MTKRFKITSQLGGDVKSCTKNEEQALKLFKNVFYNERLNSIKGYLKRAEINTVPYCIVSPLGSITIERVK